MAKLYFNYSTMNAGKTTVLLQAAHNYSERGMTPFLLTAGIDTRSGNGKIKSRIGLEKLAQIFSKNANLFTRIKKANSKRTISCVFGDGFFANLHVPRRRDSGEEAILTCRSGTHARAYKSKISKMEHHRSL